MRVRLILVNTVNGCYVVELDNVAPSPDGGEH